MSQLLLSETFDHFSFIEGEIVTFNTFRIDGRIHREFFDGDESVPAYSLWKNLRGYCFSLIKGKQTPLRFHFTLSLPPEQTKQAVLSSACGILPEDVKGLYLNIRFDGSRLSCVTGTSFRTFIMDKTLEQYWDRMAAEFFLSRNIAFEPEA